MRSAAKVTFTALSILLLFLTACSGNKTTNNTISKIVKIGTDFPVSGDDAGQGKPIENGAVLAFEQNKDLGNGYTLKYVTKNDAGPSGPDASLGAQNVQSFLNDPEVAAMVGPYNSGVAKAEIPIANNATFTMISPANTNPGLTKSAYAADNQIIFTQLHPAGKPNSYFRIPSTDDLQGRALAKFAAGAPINAKKAFVIDDSSTYGTGLAKYFTSQFTSSGGEVVGKESITKEQATSLNSLATKIVSASPDIVFYGGVTSQGGGALKKELVAAGAKNLPMLGGDGIAYDSSWLSTATPDAANGTIASIPAPDISKFTATQQQKFITDYKARFNEDPIPYSAMSYDAACIIIKAIKNLIADDKEVTRQSVRDEVAKLIGFEGVTGTIGFDANGDNNGQNFFSLYIVENGKWKFMDYIYA
jgi:branched-chain amino acid transport system substrate-binding protein